MTDSVFQQQPEILRKVIALFPAFFNLRNHEGLFRISESASYFPTFTSTTPTLYTQRLRDDGEWGDFAKGSEHELRAQMVRIDDEGLDDVIASLRERADRAPADVAQRLDRVIGALMATRKAQAPAAIKVTQIGNQSAVRTRIASNVQAAVAMLRRCTSYGWSEDDAALVFTVDAAQPADRRTYMVHGDDGAVRAVVREAKAQIDARKR